MLISLPVLDAFAQPAGIRWLPAVKTAKDQHTLALLRAGDDGFFLLRWQARRTDASGNITPAMPLLTVLTASGDRLYDAPLPGFSEGQQEFRFAVCSDSLLLVAYEALDERGVPALYARKLRLDARQWNGPPQVLFRSDSPSMPAFSNAWYHRSADGNRWCLYYLENRPAPIASVAVFDRTFHLLWQRRMVLPAQSGPAALRQAICTNQGNVLLHAQIFSPGVAVHGLSFSAPPTVYRPDGRPLIRRDEWTGADKPYANAVFLLRTDTSSTPAFYPEIGKKYTPSFELTEGPDGLVWCAGLSSNRGNEAVEGYFVYTIDPVKKEGRICQNAALPGSVRKVFLSDKAAERKDPVEGLALRWFDWSANGKGWMLVERNNFAQSPNRLETAAILRLDSTSRITSVREVEKYQRIQTGDPQNFASVAACPGPQNAWWLLWNQGQWPETKIMLTESRPSGAPAELTLDLSSHSNVSLLPQTLQYFQGKRYFVGESEFHERIRIGMIEVKQ